jgi:BASS family bile acid:Na+ symporter
LVLHKDAPGVDEGPVRFRHAAEITTAVRNIGPMLLMMIFPFAAYPLVTVSITILNAVGLI